MMTSSTLANETAAVRLGGGVRCWTLASGALPLFIAPNPPARFESASCAAWIRERRPVVDALIVEHGGVVLRGFPIVTTADFNVLAAEFPAYEGGYQGGNTARRKLSGQIYEATQLAGHHALMLHQEMFYMPDGPGRIAFFARRVAEAGGETIIGDMRRFSKDLPASVREKLLAKGVRNVRNFAAATGSMEETEHAERRGWDFAFYTDSKEEVEAICRRRRLDPIWNPDGGLTVVNTLAAFVTHPVTGELIYRAGIHGFGASGSRRPAIADSIASKVRASQVNPTAITLGDGGDLDDEEAEAVSSLVEQVTISWPWMTGDLMILENLLASHGRNPYVGERAVEVAMFQ